MKRRQAVLTLDALRDLEDLHAYIAEHGPGSADAILDRLLQVCDSLASEPGRGSIPVELRALGINDYRQIMFKPWRLIYRLQDDQIVVYLIADGRRDLQSLLAQRMLGT